MLVGLGGCFLSGDKKRATFDGPSDENEQAAITAASCDDIDPNLGVPADLAPSSTTSAGKIADSFQVSANGAAVYSMAIRVPPGRAGIEPSLALTYSSDAPNGIAGVGFSLQGLSVITRCPLNVAEDGRYREVSYDADDRFCLDGQRLVAVKGGTYGANGTEYRTRPDTFAKVISHTTSATTGPYKFTVYAKDGRILTYGDNDDPFHGGAPSTSRASALGTSSVRSWGLKRVEDRSGNFMDFTYQTRSVNGDGTGYTVEQLPALVSYTGHGTTAATRIVLFDYADRPDIWTGYSKGMRFESTKRLNGITAFAGLTLVTTYRLGYGTSVASGRSRVERVEECGADGVCKPPTVFRWSASSNNEPGYYKSEPTTPLPDPPRPDATIATPDINGDGLEDVVFPDLLNFGSPFVETIWIGALAKWGGADFGQAYIAQHDDADGAHPIVKNIQSTVIDYNQDGKDDLLLHDTRSQFWRVLLSENPDDGLTSKPFRADIIPGIKPAIAFGGRMHLADMTGDGIPDLIQCEKGEGSAPDKWRLYAHNGAGFSTTPETIEPLTSSVPNVSSAPCEQKIISFDMNGDGALELLVKEVKDGVSSTVNYKSISRKVVSSG